MKLRVIIGVAVVVGILVVLGVLSPAKLRYAKCTWRQREAKSTLEQIGARIVANQAKGRPAATFDDLAWYPKGDHHYDYSISIGFNGHFQVEARATDVNGDAWTIDENNNLTNQVDGCARDRS